MPSIRTLVRSVIATGGCAALSLLAQDAGPSYAFKIRAGLTAGDLRKDHDTNQAMGFDVAGRFPLGDRRFILAELGFDYLPGRDHDAMPRTGSVYYMPESPATEFGGQPLWLNPNNSIDWRKESLQGFSLRGAYQAPIPGSAWYWFAGASLDMHKATGQFSGTLIPSYGDAPGTAVPGYVPVDPSNPDGPVKDYYEGWSFVTDKTKFGLGLLAGVGVPVKDYCDLEFRVRNLAYTHFDYRPFTYTGSAPVLAETTRRGFVFEIAVSVNL